MEAELKLANSNQNFEQRKESYIILYVRNAENKTEAEFKFYQSKSSSCRVQLAEGQTQKKRMEIYQFSKNK